MLNFRAKKDLVDRINEAAERTGMDRSTFMRIACDEKSMNVLTGPRPRIGTDTQAKDDAPKTERVKPEECPHPKENVNFIPGVNLRHCNLCNAKFK